MTSGKGNLSAFPVHLSFYKLFPYAYVIKQSTTFVLISDNINI